MDISSTFIVTCTYKEHWVCLSVVVFFILHLCFIVALKEINVSFNLKQVSSTVFDRPSLCFIGGVCVCVPDVLRAVRLSICRKHVIIGTVGGALPFRIVRRLSEYLSCRMLQRWHCLSNHEGATCSTTAWCSGYDYNLSPLWQKTGNR